MVTGQSGDTDLLQIEIHHFRLVEQLVSFPKSPRSSKSEFKTKSYAQNMKGWLCWFGHAAGGGGATPRLGYALATSLVAFSTLGQSKLALFFSFSSPTWSKSPPITPPLQMCQHHYVFTILCMCVSFSQMFSKGLVTQFTTPLDPSNDAKLDHSSGTR